MNPLNNFYRSAILYELKAELQKHHANFQRALDGTNYRYVPTSAQRDTIAAEQNRLSSILVGIDALQRLWNIKGNLRHSGKGLSLNNYDILRTASAVAYMQAFACNIKKVHPVYTSVELAGLKDLFVYVDCKLDAQLLPFENRYEYSTVGTDLGYIRSSEKYQSQKFSGE